MASAPISSACVARAQAAWVVIDQTMRTLVIGFGNPSRQDDGVGLAVVNGLRSRAGLSPLDDTMDGFETLGQPLDTLFLQQLTPELGETLAGYDSVIFVDAYLGNIPSTGKGATGQDFVRRLVVEPHAGPSLVSHHMKPGMLLALTGQLYGAVPTAELISI